MIFSANCQIKQCKRRCQNGGRCNTKIGKCVCVGVWSGEFCSEVPKPKIKKIKNIKQNEITLELEPILQPGIIKLLLIRSKTSGFLSQNISRVR